MKAFAIRRRGFKTLLHALRQPQKTHMLIDPDGMNPVGIRHGLDDALLTLFFAECVIACEALRKFHMRVAFAVQIFNERQLELLMLVPYGKRRIPNFFDAYELRRAPALLPAHYLPVVLRIVFYGAELDGYRLADGKHGARDI